MTSASQPTITPGQLASLLRRHPRRWLVPAVVVAALVGLYALVRPARWEASQALIVRNEAANNQNGPGKFSHTAEMKTVQDTIFELVRSPAVLSAALRGVGPPADADAPAAWPTDRDVVRLREAVKLTPPNGAEFGTTEVFYLKVRCRDRRRAAALATAIVDGLQARFQQLLDDRGTSMVREVEKTVALAEADLDVSIHSLAELERSVGVDLAELRILHESPAGSSDLRQKVVEVDNESRKARTDRRAKAELLSLLRSCEGESTRMLALPHRLLESQASLRQLIDGLNAARLKTCSLMGEMSDEHPLVRAATAEEDQIVRKLTQEWAGAVAIAEIELRLADGRVESLEGQLTDLRGRFNRLAGLRARYADAVAETENRTALVETARRTLADARASRAASLVDGIDSPDTGIHPVGPSRAMIVLAGLVGGLLAGVGLVFLTAQPEHRSAPAPAPPDVTPFDKGKHENESRKPRLGRQRRFSLTEALMTVAEETDR
ncbi:MAG: GumC domain-containing protein [Planctomycetota bacterium]|jgi:uncharacterized protein involved in exopolysaccharide biosynthesis